MRPNAMTRFFLNERNMMAAITLNALIIFVMYFPAFRNDLTIERIDQAFIGFFILEALVKMNHWSVKGYFERGWNRFDFTIIVLSLPSLLTYLIEIPDTSLIIILRLFRVVRLIRFVRFIPNLTKILDGLGRALKASVFVLMALFFLNFLLAIVTCHFFADIAPQLFGDPLISAFTIFQLFTIEGWNDIPAEVIKVLPNERWLIWITRFYFGTIVLIGGIFGMSLANAVFVDEMTIDNNLELERKIDGLQTQIRELKQMIQEQRRNP